MESLVWDDTFRLLLAAAAVGSSCSQPGCRYRCGGRRLPPRHLLPPALAPHFRVTRTFQGGGWVEPARSHLPARAPAGVPGRRPPPRGHSPATLGATPAWRPLSRLRRAGVARWRSPLRPDPDPGSGGGRRAPQKAAGANVPGPSPITEQEREAGAREPGPSPIRVRDTRHRAGCGPAPEAVVPYRTHLSAAKAAGPRPGRGRPRSLRLFLSLRHLPLLTLATRRGARSARRRRARPLVVTLLGATSMHQASSFSGDWS